MLQSEPGLQMSHLLHIFCALVSGVGRMRISLGPVSFTHHDYVITSSEWVPAKNSSLKIFRQHGNVIENFWAIWAGRGFTNFCSPKYIDLFNFKPNWQQWNLKRLKVYIQLAVEHDQYSFPSWAKKDYIWLTWRWRQVWGARHCFHRCSGWCCFRQSSTRAGHRERQGPCLTSSSSLWNNRI